MEHYDIFISYRRNGGYETAKHLYDKLSNDGYSVSFDIDTLRSGDFDTELLKRVDECMDFILILNKGAFNRTVDPDVNPNQDWLRQEVAYALSKKKHIIPLCLEGFEGFPDNLPDDVAEVQYAKGPEYSNTYFDEYYQLLKANYLYTANPEAYTVKDAEKNQAIHAKQIKGLIFGSLLCIPVYVIAGIFAYYASLFVQLYLGGGAASIWTTRILVAWFIIAMGYYVIGALWLWLIKKIYSEGKYGLAFVLAAGGKMFAIFSKVPDEIIDKIYKEETDE